MGYHNRKIEKGELGEFSKIKEEFEELEDSLEQNNPIMALVELSDLYGAIILYLEKNHPSIEIKDLETMSRATAKAFKSGARK